MTSPHEHCSMTRDFLWCAAGEEYSSADFFVSVPTLRALVRANHQPLTAGCEHASECLMLSLLSNEEIRTIGIESHYIDAGRLLRCRQGAAFVLSSTSKYISARTYLRL